MKICKQYFWPIISIVVFILDRVTKTLVMQLLLPEQPVKVFPNFNLFFTFNTGAAFSFLSNASGWQNWLFIMIASVVSISIIVWQINNTKQPVTALKIAFALILGGALGNLYDRIVYKYVIDFLDFYFHQWHYPTFNFADSAICIGAGILLLSMLRKNEEE